MLQKRRKYQCFFIYRHKNGAKYSVFGCFWHKIDYNNNNNNIINININNNKKKNNKNKNNDNNNNNNNNKKKKKNNIWHLVTLVRADPAAERREYELTMTMIKFTGHKTVKDLIPERCKILQW